MSIRLILLKDAFFIIDSFHNSISNNSRSRLLDDIKRDFLSSNTKYNLLVRQWFTKEKKEIKLKPVNKNAKHLFIERDRIITVNTKRVAIKNERKVIEDMKKQYQVLAVFAKSYNNSL